MTVPPPATACLSALSVQLVIVVCVVALAGTIELAIASATPAPNTNAAEQGPLAMVPPLCCIPRLHVMCQLRFFKKLHTIPDDQSTSWSTRTMGERHGVGKDTVARIWRARSLRPWRVETFNLALPE